MNVRSFNVTPISHFVKAEPLSKFFLIFFKCDSPKKKKNFKHDEQKGLNTRQH